MSVLKIEKLSLSYGSTKIFSGLCVRVRLGDLC